jgi:hypothetical protein
MQLREMIKTFSEDVAADEALLALDDIALFAEVRHAAARFDETTGEYAAGSVRRFANLASSEDWLSLMNIIERANDPGADCLGFMVKWSLKQDAMPAKSPHAGCTCGGGGSCA